jgi:hypothetical protein
MPAAAPVLVNLAAGNNPAGAAVIDDAGLMHLIAEAGVSAEQRVALAQLLGLSTAGPGADSAAAAAAAAGSGQQQLGVTLEPVFNCLQLFHPQLSMLLQRKAQQVMIAQQQQLMLRQQQQQQQCGGMPRAAAPAAGAYPVQVMQPTGPAAAAAAAGGVLQYGFGMAGAVVGRTKRSTGGRKRRDADFSWDSDEEYNVHDPSTYEPRLHR